MKPQLKPISEQTLVITGASSGIGLATAKLAGRRGANVVLVSRDPDDLEAAAEAVRQEGGNAATVVVDVADRIALNLVVEQAEEAFGGFDTWVNNAGASIFGRLIETPEEDARQLFETNYWGVVHGSEVAVAHLREKGGALINIGSVLSDRAIPLQGHYSASKHAVKGYTDALRMEVEKDDLPISVTLVKPSSIDTPYPEHAKNLMDKAATLPPPVYAPEVVAETILRCAEQPVREITVGAGGRVLAGLGMIAPRLMDKVMEATMFKGQQLDEPATHAGEALHEPHPGDSRERGDRIRTPVLHSSLYTQARLHPGVTLLGLAALGAGLALAAR